jgi:hypothetical protein
VQAPNIKLLSSPTISLEKGDAIEVELVVKNIGTSSAINLLTQAETGDGPFSVVFLNSSNSTASVNENATHTMTLRIVADANAKTGAYALKLNHSYRTQDRRNESSSDLLSVRVTGTDTAPNVVLNAFRTDVVKHTPGSTFRLTVPIQNLGDGAARNVQISLDKSLDTKTVRPVSGLENAQFNAMAAEYTGTLNFTFEIDEKARNGTYPVQFNLAYRDEAGERYEENFIYYLTLSVEAEPRIMLEIRDMTAPTGYIRVDQNGLFTFQVFNTSATPAYNIEIKTIEYDETAIRPKSQSVQLINSLPAETGRLMTFTFAPTALAKSRAYTIGFQVEYEAGYDDENKPLKHTFKQYASISVYNPDEDKDKDEPDRTPKPRMIVSEYIVEPLIVSAGQNFDLTVTFQNASATKAVNNIKVTLEAKESTERNNAVFTPVGGSNTFFIDHLDPKETTSRTLNMFTVPDADPRNYKLDVTFDYQDEDYFPHTEAEQIGINVKQTTRLEISSEPSLPDHVSIGERVNFWFSIINSGKVSLTNVRVRVEGAFDTSEADMFIGNLGRGGNISYEGVIVPLVAGTQQGKIVVFGEDSTGDIVDYEYEFTLNVMEMFGGGDMMFGDGFGDRFEFGEMGDMFMPEEEKSPMQKMLDFVKKPYFWGPLAAVLIALVVTVIVLKHRKDKKAVDFDE